MILISNRNTYVEGYYVISEDDILLPINNIKLVQMHPTKVVIDKDVNKKKIQHVIDAIKLKCEVEELV